MRMGLGKTRVPVFYHRVSLNALIVAEKTAFDDALERSNSAQLCLCQSLTRRVLCSRIVLPVSSLITLPSIAVLGSGAIVVRFTEQAELFCARCQPQPRQQDLQRSCALRRCRSSVPPYEYPT